MGLAMVCYRMIARRVEGRRLDVLSAGLELSWVGDRIGWGLVR